MVQVKMLASTLRSQINGGGDSNKQDKQGDWKCVCVVVCVCVCVCWVGVCVDGGGGGVEYRGTEGQKMVNRVPLRLI